MRKKQKINKKKKSQRSYKDFISLIKWHKNDFDIISHISNIYENGNKRHTSFILWQKQNLLRTSNHLH